MEGPVTSHLARSTTLDTIEPDLAALWREIAHEGPVARAVMSNLVVFRAAERAQGGMADDTLDDVVARHPCRLIVLEHQRGAPRVPPAFEVAIRIVTFGGERARYGIEQIAVRSACAETCLPSIVRQLVRGDVPTSVWWMEDVSQAPPLEPIVRMARQFVYDSRGWRDIRRALPAVASLLRSGHRLDLSDMNWRRLTALRQALLNACTPAQFEELARGHVRIVHCPGEASLAWLTVGWLASRLHWEREIAPAVEEGPPGDAVLAVHVGGEPAHLSATLDGHDVMVKSTAGAAPMTIPIRRETRGEAVAEELRNLSHDVCLHEAVRAAALFLQ
jgi:glucose-6-phosphate dehydrogenase assembly protein OpcA